MEIKNFENFGAKLISTTPESFYTISIIVFLFVFMIRLMNKNSSFEYLKITTLIIVFTISLNSAFLGFKDNQVFRAESRIIVVESSSINRADKLKYTNEAKEIIKKVKSQEIERISNIIYGVGRIFLFGILIILLRDLFLPALPNIKLIIYNKYLERNSLP